MDTRNNFRPKFGLSFAQRFAALPLNQRSLNNNNNEPRSTGISAASITFSERTRQIRMAHIMHNFNYRPPSPKIDFRAPPPPIDFHAPPPLIDISNFVVTNFTSKTPPPPESDNEEGMPENMATVTRNDEANFETPVANYPLLDELQMFAGKLRNEKLARRQNSCAAVETKPWPSPPRYEDFIDIIERDTNQLPRNFIDPTDNFPSYPSNDVITEKSGKQKRIDHMVTNPAINIAPEQSFDSNKKGLNVNAPEFVPRSIRANNIIPMGSIPKILEDPIIKSVLLKQRSVELEHAQIESKNTVESEPYLESALDQDDISVTCTDGSAEEMEEEIPQINDEPLLICYDKEELLAIRKELRQYVKEAPIILTRNFDDKYGRFQPARWFEFTLWMEGPKKTDHQKATQDQKMTIRPSADVQFSTTKIHEPDNNSPSRNNLSNLGLTFNSRRNIGTVQ